MRAYIVEDEIIAQRSLARLLSQNFPDMEVVGNAASVKETVEWLKSNPDGADIIFLDVELTDGICFEIFKQVDVKAKVIMTTAYDSYALKAFEAGSVDYLLKPIDPADLKRAVARCRMSGGHIDVDALVKAMGLKVSAPVAEYKERYVIKLNDRIIPINISDIAYIYSEDKNNYLVTFSEKKYIIDSTLDDICEELNPDKFFRISRSCIICSNAISSIVKQGGGRLKIQATPASSFDMTVSRSRVEDFLSWLEK